MEAQRIMQGRRWSRERRRVSQTEAIRPEARLKWLLAKPSKRPYRNPSEEVRTRNKKGRDLWRRISHAAKNRDVRKAPTETKSGQPRKAQHRKLVNHQG